jgi:RNA polymerase sigma-70 factor, ECF subfamily
LTTGVTPGRVARISDMAPSAPVSRPGTSAVGQPPDQDLAERCREWYEAYGHQVYSYIRFHVTSADTAEDVTAETFLKALRANADFDPAKGSARVWLFRIAENTLRDHFRRTRIRQHVSLTGLRDLAVDAPSTEERLLWEEQVARLLEAVGSLGERDRDLVSLRYGSGLPTSAIAEIRGMSDAAVRKGLSRALHRLRHALVERP